MEIEQKKLESTYAVEREKWDQLARGAENQIERKILKSNDDFYKYAERTATMVGVNEFLGDLQGKRILEYGCGLGEITSLLAKTTGNVVAFDLSKKSVEVARLRGRTNGVEDHVSVVVAAGERLPYADESFDVVFGKAILHHIDPNLGYFDLSRVLRKGGKGVFVEPLGMNPFLRFARAHLPYPSKNPRGADRPLDYKDIQKWGSRFEKFHYKEIQFLSMLERAFGFGKRFHFLRRLDEQLLEHWSYLRRYCRYVVMYMIK